MEFGKPVMRPLQYIAAADVLPVLVQALTEPGEGSAGRRAGESESEPAQQPESPADCRARIRPVDQPRAAPASDSTLQVSEELSTEPVDTAPQAVTVGNTKLIADARANTIIVLGNREVVVKVEKILDEMDVKAPQVALSTVIGELSPE